MASNKEEVTADAKLLGIFKSKTKEETDSKLASPSQPKQPTVVEGVDPYADYYKMDHARRGVALIFNHFTFDDFTMSERKGTEVDAQCIKELLTMLKYDVRLYNDSKYDKVMATIKAVSMEDHSNADSLVVIVMSHGDTDVIHARDFTYNPKKLWEPFAGNKCTSLAGKPKMFFIQACRGDQLDSGQEIKRSVVYDGGRDVSYTIPAAADFLVMYSTAENHYSFRSPIQGSWFIQCLCKELKARSNYQDLLTILTFVNRRMAIAHKSNVPTNQDFHNKKQVGSIVSSLTRLVYFNC